MIRKMMIDLFFFIFLMLIFLITYGICAQVTPSGFIYHIYHIYHSTQWYNNIIIIPQYNCNTFIYHSTPSTQYTYHRTPSSTTTGSEILTRTRFPLALVMQFISTSINFYTL